MTSSGLVAPMVGLPLAGQAPPSPSGLAGARPASRSRSSLILLAGIPAALLLASAAYFAMHHAPTAGVPVASSSSAGVTSASSSVSSLASSASAVAAGSACP